MKRIYSVLIALSIFALLPCLVHAGMLPPPFDSGELADLRAAKIASGLPYAIMLADDRVIDLSEHFVLVAGTDRHALNVDLDQYGIGQRVHALVDPDPFITFGATTVNLIAGPTTFAFLFGTPIVPGNYTNVTSTGGVTVTNGVGGTTTVANSAVYPTFISGYGRVGVVPTNVGVDLGTGPVVASGPPTATTVTQSFGTTANSFAPTFYDGLEALLTYSQDDISSVSSWSGAVTIVVPEPATIGMVVFAGGAMALRRRT